MQSIFFIDQCVIKACKEHIPSTAIGFDNPKVHVHICDGAEYVGLHKKTFDIIIIDSSDPIGMLTALTYVLCIVLINCAQVQQRLYLKRPSIAV